MGWRTVVITDVSKLDFQTGFLVVRNSSLTKVHINEIDVLIIENTACSLTAYLLNELSKRKIKVIFCDEKRYPSFEIVPYYGCHDTSAKIKNQMKWDNDIKACVWTKIVSEKIRHQSDILKWQMKSESYLLDKCINEIKYNDISNREAFAAKIYFNALFGTNFSRKLDTPINAALNYGYTLVLSLISREIVANGYLTQIGITHRNTFNHFNVASDFIEPFRPVVDRMVIELEPKKFDKEEKHSMMSLFNRELLIFDRKELLSNAIRIYVKSVLNSLNEKNPAVMVTFDYEL